MFMSKIVKRIKCNVNFDLKKRVKKLYNKRKQIKNDPKAFYKVFKKITRHFCYNTALHGYKFIGSTNLSTIERFGWGIIVFGALVTSLCLISLSLEYENTKGATITMTDSTYFPIYQYLYPGISVCNFNKISKKKALAMAEILSSDPKEIPRINKNLTVLANLYFNEYDPKLEETYKLLQASLEAVNMTADQALMDITPKCTDLMFSCTWKGRRYRCDALFQDTLTPEGLCCSFNHYNLKSRVFSGYNAERYKPKPRKLAACGEQTGLRVVLQTDPDDYLVSEFSAHGAKVLIHDTYNYPEWNSKVILATPLVYTSVNIVPYYTYATKEVHHVNLRDRECVNMDERQLHIYSNYSHENCLNECRIDIIQKKCGCIPFYYRNQYLDTDFSTRNCNLTDIVCLSLNKYLYQSSVPGYDEALQKPSKDKKHVWGEEVGSCNCLPPCDYRDYLISSTHGNLNLDTLTTTFGVARNFSVVNIFYRDLLGTLNKTDVYKRWHALLGLLGGLLGLCIGFSITGAFGLIYYYTIRLFFDAYSALKIRPQKQSKRDKQPKEIREKIKQVNSKKTNSITKIFQTKKNKLNRNIPTIYNTLNTNLFHVKVPKFKMYKKKELELFYLE